MVIVETERSYNWKPKGRGGKSRKRNEQLVCISHLLTKFGIMYVMYIIVLSIQYQYLVTATAIHNSSRRYYFGSCSQLTGLNF